MTKIGNYLKKEYWRRRVPDLSSINARKGVGADYYVDPISFRSGGAVQLLTQEDFMREFETTAHDINSDLQSMRPVYDSRPILDAEGSPMLDENGEPMTEWYIASFDPIETVRYGWQRRIDLSKAAYLGGGNLWICHESPNHEVGAILNSWKDVCGLQQAWMELVQSCCITGDGAIYLYTEGNTISYQVFSYAKGDMLFPHYDDNHNPMLVRLYSLCGKRAVDIYACGYVETWIEGDSNTEKSESWFSRFSGWFAKGLNWQSTTLSEDGWRLMSRKTSQIDNSLCQCVYFRVDDVPHGPAQLDIEALERSATFVSDGVKSVSQPILFVKAHDIESLPKSDSTGKVIGVKGTIDELNSADAKFLAPPDVSNIATIDLAAKNESIKGSTLFTEITEKIFSAGADSSASMQLMFTPEIIWAKNEIVKYYPQLKYLIEVFKAFVAKVEGRGDIATLQTSCGIDIYIPRNEAERLRMEIDQVTARVKSRKSAIADIGNSHVEDYEQIQREWEEELRIKSEIPAKAKADATPQAPQEDTPIQEEPIRDHMVVDNRHLGKTIVDN